MCLISGGLLGRPASMSAPSSKRRADSVSRPLDFLEAVLAG